MGIQVLLRASTLTAAESALGALAPKAEIFAIEQGLFGASIPTAVVNSVGEQVVFGQLASFEHYELWSGAWRTPKSKLKLW
jgi:hypothetical protein